MGEYIEKVWLPQALTIGIPYETFLILNPRTIKPFVKAFNDKKEEERATINYTAWLNGIYVSKAISACFSKNCKYPDKPIDLGIKKETEEKPLSHAERFGAWAIAFNNAHKELPEGV